MVQFCGDAWSKIEARHGRTAPDPYTPRHLSEAVLGQRGALEGERKPLSVLFADVVDSMQLTERVDALSKGIGRGDAWNELLDLALHLAGKPAVPLVLREPVPSRLAPQ